mgnify:CR=1 FL=1
MFVLSLSLAFRTVYSGRGGGGGGGGGSSGGPPNPSSGYVPTTTDRPLHRVQITKREVRGGEGEGRETLFSHLAIESPDYYTDKIKQQRTRPNKLAISTH